MGFSYLVLSTLLNPLVVCLVCLLAAKALSKFKVGRRVCFWTGFAVLLAGGNEWVVNGLVRHLERRYMPSIPVPEADCIVILSGGTLSQLPPRPTVEVDEAGNRVLYGAYLYRQGKAPSILCTGAASIGAVSRRPAAEDMAELLENLGIPNSSILLETKARNTHEHAVNLHAMLTERGFKRVLLVTSAMHMPRSMGVFSRLCPGIHFIPAPTDFHAVQETPQPWYYALAKLVPTPRRLLECSEAMHEYVGLAYYRLRGWA